MFDAGPGTLRVLPTSLVPVDGKIIANPKIKNERDQNLEEYYKWQFIYALIYSGLYAKDYIGTEIRFPKGNKMSAPLRLDAAIFDDASWLSRYADYWKNRRPEDLEWLNHHLLAVIEFKKNDKEIDKVVSGQVRPAMKEKDPATAYVLGIYYDAERLYLFHRRDGFILRYDESKNLKKDRSQIGDLSLHLPDPYVYLPSFEELRNRVHRPATLDRSNRTIDDLERITSIAIVQLQTALSYVLRAMDKAGLVNQRGYQLFIEAFALKIFDEKRNEKNPKRKLNFYVTDAEAGFQDLTAPEIQTFVTRMQLIWSEAEGRYQKILSAKAIDWKNLNHVRSLVAVCSAFQDFSFVRSAKSDLYQLVFYNFANTFTRDESGQFLTPLPVIDFLVRIVNPRNGETVLDPCCGIADFLSLCFVHAQEKADYLHLDDANIYGVDLDENMVMLATLNMLLNGDGEAKLFHKPDLGSILYKIAADKDRTLVELLPDYHRNGNWDNWPDNTKLFKFDVVLTNPPFGEDRAFRPRTDFERRVIETYDTWNIVRNLASAEEAGGDESSPKPRSKSSGFDAIDLGIVFLENSYRCLKVGGRLGIVLSNSLASINRWRKVREWLLDRMRLVAAFDLPSNVFAETGVNTTLIVAYKPEPLQLQQLNRSGYSVFVRDIHNVGYEKRTSKRNVFFNPVYRFDEKTFEIQLDLEGRPVLEEDFTKIISDFKTWVLGQEEDLRKLFLE